MDNAKTHVVEEVIEKLSYFVRLYSIDSLFIVGGYCRSMVMEDEDVNDIDVASAFPEQSMILCGLFASEILQTTPTFYHRTGTGMVEYKGVKVEFQNQSVNSYMFNDSVVEWMRQNNVPDIPLAHNVYGRDFTIYALIYDLKDKELVDITRRAVSDINKKVIATILPANMTVPLNPLVILRAIRFAIKYDFMIHPELRKAMKRYGHLLFKSYSSNRILNEVKKILEVDTEKAIEQFKKYRLENLLVPKTIQEFVEIAKKEEQ